MHGTHFDSSHVRIGGKPVIDDAIKAHEGANDRGEAVIT